MQQHTAPVLMHCSTPQSTDIVALQKQCFPERQAPAHTGCNGRHTAYTNALPVGHVTVVVSSSRKLVRHHRQDCIIATCACSAQAIHHQVDFAEKMLTIHLTGLKWLHS